MRLPWKRKDSEAQEALDHAMEQNKVVTNLESKAEPVIQRLDQAERDRDRISELLIKALMKGGQSAGEH